MKISELGSFGNGKAKPLKKGDIPVYGGNGIMDYTNESNYKSDTIVIGRVGANCGSVTLSSERCWVSDNAIAFTVKLDYDVNYIYNYMKLLNLNNYHIGSSQPLLTQGIIGDIDIEIADRLTQSRVARTLVNIDKKLALNNKMSCELEILAKTIYDYWFVQYDFPNKEGKPYKTTGGKMVWVEELSREIPEGWQVGILGNFFDSNRGLSYNSSSIEGDGVPMINLASFNVDGSYKHDGLKTYSGVYSDEKVLKPFDLVMCNTQQTAIDYKKDIIGKAFLVPDIFDGDIVSSHHVTTININNEDLKFYLYRLFNTDYFHKYAAGYCSGTNILGLVFSGIENYNTEIPEPNVLKKYAKIMLDIEKKKSVIIKENQELASLRDWLLPMLMNGQVTFKESR